MSPPFSPDDLSRALDGARPSASPDDDPVALGRGRRALRTGDHAAILYWRTEELLDAVVPYLAAGIEVGDKVVYVADELAPAQLEEALRARGVDVETMTSAGRLAIVRSSDAFFPDGRFDLERALDGIRALARQAAADGYRRVRFSVEMTYLLADVPGIEHGPTFEARANDDVFAQYPFVCVCSFNANRATQTRIITDVLATHPIVISGGVPLLNPHYRR